VTVKISGGGQSAKAIVAHLTYLSRQEFEIEAGDNEQLLGKGQEKNLVDNWEPDLDAAQSRSRATFTKCSHLIQRHSSF
jgi:hypothetical protein